MTPFERIVQVEYDHMRGPPVFPQWDSPLEEGEVKEEKVRPEGLEEE